ncbi:MAG: hypothetical protein ACREER_01305, partial [Alphaproteobacteria bacterium]
MDGARNLDDGVHGKARQRRAAIRGAPRSWAGRWRASIRARFRIQGGRCRVPGVTPDGQNFIFRAFGLVSSTSSALRVG